MDLPQKTLEACSNSASAAERIVLVGKEGGGEMEEPRRREAEESRVYAVELSFAPI